MNRSEWMANKFKDGNMNTYDWVPEVMPTINPAPVYRDRDLGTLAGRRLNRKRAMAEALDKSKNAILAR